MPSPSPVEVLRYDTVDYNKVWRGAVMVVTADAGSHYDPHPMLTLEWNESQGHTRSSSVPNGESWQRAPRRSRRESLPGQVIFVYHSAAGSFSFWRFLIEIPLGAHEMSVKYALNQGVMHEFFVPGSTQNMRWAAHSCNGFSSGINPDDFKSSAYETGYDPVWSDLLEKHAESPFHVLVGGGDQIYCDGYVEPQGDAQSICNQFRIMQHHARAGATRLACYQEGLKQDGLSCNG
ncbi:hypothetical protein FRB94_014416 [Tulasnella sp. JGI-2019a]|nr:hypothetical protein FRB94_014416 [Tulasnella sp. JGI-2019a]